MIKPHKPTRPGGDSPEQQLVTLVLGPLSDLIEKTRLDILEKVQSIEESVNMIARQLKRQIPPGQ
jgi:hypothetical protein